jgi:enoyl-CoA hydratase
MIEVEHRKGVAVVRLSHGKVNALDQALAEAITATMRELADSCIVLTGAGRAFSAGVDLRRVVEGGPEYVAAFLPALDDALVAVFDAPGPVIAAVNGHAIAGGCILAAACDLRLMSGGTMGITELLVGLPFPPAALEIVRHAVGPRVEELAFTGRTFDPASARELGLVHEILPPEVLLDEAVRRAEALARIPPTVYRLTKQQLRAGPRQRLDEARRRHGERVVAAWQAPEARTAAAVYLERL